VTLNLGSVFCSRDVLMQYPQHADDLRVWRLLRAPARG